MMIGHTGCERNTDTGKSMRILIADDVAQVRHGLATVLALATKNHHPSILVVGEAENGSEAITQAEQLQPDVVLMDLEMPGVDGYAATRQIKSAQPAIGVVILTIHNDEATRLKAAQAGADAFIEKGTPLDDLIYAILQAGRK